MTCRLNMAAVLALAMLMAVGCQGPFEKPSGEAPLRGRSLALETPRQRRLAAAQPRDALPWYAARNDERLATTAGYIGPTVETSYTFTRDRQTQFSGRVRDHYSSTRYHQEIRQSVR